MTLDRTKKYKVGEVVFRASNQYSSDEWSTEINGLDYYFTEDRLLALNPVEVEEPLKWSFETSYCPPGGDIITWIGKAAWKEIPNASFQHRWRHEVVSTRIG